MNLLSKFWITQLAGAALLLGGCAAPSSYMGISLNPNAVDIGLRRLAERAMAGDKQAKLALGIRFEDGQGIDRDLVKAKKLYREAASNSGRPIWVYTPSVGNGLSGRLVTVGIHSQSGGLEDAKLRLMRIERLETEKHTSLPAYFAGKDIEAGSHQFQLKINGVFTGNNVRIETIEKKCPDPSLISRKIECNNKFFESEILLTYSQKNNCFKYNDLKKMLPQDFSEQQTLMPLADGGHFSVPQQTSFVSSNSIILAYPGFESQETCVVRIVLVQSAK